MEEIQDRENVERISDDYRTELLMDLRDPSYAAGYLKAILSDGDPETIIIALKDIADAYKIDGNASIDANYIHGLASSLREQVTKLDEMTQKLENMHPGIAQPTTNRVWEKPG